MLDVIAQYDNVAPTRETIVSLFKDDGFTHNEVIQAIENLAEVQSIIYLRRSNSYLKLKESSGISIDSAITERVKKLKIEYALEDLLNFMLQGRALYPSGYNDEHRIVRYFTCKFITLPQFNNLELNSVVDGEVLAFLPDNPDEINKGVVEARRATENHKTLVVAVPKKYHEICDEVYRLKAAIQLKEEAEDDSVLKEEYEIVIEDMREIVDGFIGLYFQPELRGVFYIEGGKKRNKINRKHHLSKLLSSVCDKAFPYTPYITSEALNKNELTGTAFASRSKILNTICLCKDKDTINFDGRGQEYSMMRSALVATGLAKSGNQTKIESDIKRVISYIESFFNAASGDSFVTIYNELTERHNGIGMRKGPIPIYLAWVMKDYEEEIKVTHNGEEKTICGALFDDISKCPGEYFVYRINWTPQMAIYTTGLAVLFNCTGEKKTRNEVASAIMRWYIELPRVTRNATVDYSSVSGCKEISTIRKKFFNLLKRIDLDADEILFDKLPTLFGCTQLTGDLLERIAKEKRDCDNYLDNVKNALIKKTIEIFEPGAPNEASLGSVLHGWIENNPDVNIVVLDGVENQLVKAMIKAAGNDKIIIEQLAKTATALRIEDWNDQRFSDFLFLVESIKDKVENEPKTKNKLLSANCITINFTDDQGKDASRIFNRVKCGGRADILRSQLRSALEDMGGSMQDEEKRQVLFDVLMELC